MTPEEGLAAAADPIFVDGTGTRRRWFGIISAAGGVLLVLAIAMVVAGFVGGGTGHLPGLPGFPHAEAGVPPTVAGSVAADGRTTPTPSRTPPRTTSAGPIPSPGPAPSPSPSSSPTRPGRRNTA